MAPFLTPHQLKDVLIDFYSLDPILVSGQDTRPLESLAMINLDWDDGSIFVIPPLSDSHEQLNKYIPREEWLSRAVRQFHPTRIPRKFYEDCIKLLDKELEEISPDLLKITNVNDEIFRTKVIILVGSAFRSKSCKLTILSRLE